MAIATPGWDRFRSENYSGEEKQQRLDCHLSVLPSSYWTDTTASRQEFHYRNLWEMSILLKMFFIFSIKNNLNQSWWWSLPCYQIWASCSEVWGHWLQPSWPRQCRLTTAVVGGERGVEPGSPTAAAATAGVGGGAPLQWSGTSSRTATTSTSHQSSPPVFLRQRKTYSTFTGPASADCRVLSIATGSFPIYIFW